MTNAGTTGTAQIGVPCCTHIGPDGAGHFVEMVHNGIEYSDMQRIGEAYQLLRDGLGKAAPEIAEVFDEWNKGHLDTPCTGILMPRSRRQRATVV